jgi:hypothetical protein
MSFTQDLFSSRRNYEDGNVRIGQLDRIWYDEHRNAFYIGDGATLGGKLIGGGGGAGMGYNTRLVTTDSYTVVQSDYYVGVNYAGVCTITLPVSTNGDKVVIKDESGLASVNNIILAGNVDNDPGGAILAVDNGAIHMIYRDGWRII